MAEQEKKRPGAELTDDQAEQVAGGEEKSGYRYCCCSSPDYVDGEACVYCKKCGKPKYPKSNIQTIF